MISWIQVVANRRETRADSGNREGPFVSEKEFLLAHSQQINANPAGMYDISAATSDHTLNNPRHMSATAHETVKY
jgi:hypothetical protein